MWKLTERPSEDGSCLIVDPVLGSSTSNHKGSPEQRRRPDLMVKHPGRPGSHTTIRGPSLRAQRDHSPDISHSNVRVKKFITVTNLKQNVFSVTQPQ